MSAGSRAMVALVLASFTSFRVAEILCTLSCLTSLASWLDNSFLHRSERLEPEPPQPQSRHGRTTARSNASGPQHHTPRAPVAHTAAPVPARTRQHRPRNTTNTEDEVVVDAIFSAHSDGLMVILRHASTPSGGAQPAQPATQVARPSKKSGTTSSSSK